MCRDIAEIELATSNTAQRSPVRARCNNGDFEGETLSLDKNAPSHPLVLGWQAMEMPIETATSAPCAIQQARFPRHVVGIVCRRLAAKAKLAGRTSRKILIAPFLSSTVEKRI